METLEEGCDIGRRAAPLDPTIAVDRVIPEAAVPKEPASKPYQDAEQGTA
jgi:hypothetical protein